MNNINWSDVQVNGTSDIHMCFIPVNPKLLSIAFLIESQTHLGLSLSIHWVKQYLVDLTGLAGTENAVVYKTELLFPGMANFPNS